MKLLSRSLFIVVSLILFSCGGKGEENSTDTHDITGVDSVSATVDLENNLSKKKELLQTLVGTHQLVNISGFTGANTMLDYTLEDSVWSTWGSSNVGGEREAFDIEMSEEGMRKLNSMKIVVDDSLNLRIECLGVVYRSIPFKEDGMSYFLSIKPEEFISNVPEDLKPASTFLKEDLYLYAEDEIPAREMELVDIMEISADAAILNYDTREHLFELILFEGGCCNTGIYTFKKN